MSTVENLNQVRNCLRTCCKTSGRDERSVNLIAVSKTYPVPVLREAYEASQRLFGENKVQELAEKVPVLPADIEWHLIGHLQSNKAAKAVELAHWIHAVDSETLLTRLDRLSAEQGKRPHILLEVNISGEESKHGFYPEQVHAAAAVAFQCPNLSFQGLMTMAPEGASEAEARRIFSALRSLRDYLEGAFNVSLPHLSMGMSADYGWAVAEGATFVRIGSAIFGVRS